MRLRICLFIALMLICLGTAEAQRIGLTHVIPQVADGGGYITLIFISKQTADPSVVCAISGRGGIPFERISEPSITISSANSAYVTSTTAGVTLVTGYINILCSASVSVNATYVYSVTGKVRSGATIFSQNSFARAQFPAIHQAPGLRFALSVANDSSSTITYQVTAAIGGNLIGKQFTLAPFSSKSQFLDEMLALPAGFNPLVVEVSASSPVNAIGFMFFDDVFTTVPATIYQ